MRSFILIIVCVFCLAIGFLVYYWTQPNRKVSGGPASTTMQPIATLPHNDTAKMQISGVWVVKYDPNGRPVSQFRAAEYNPQQDGRVLVVEPVADFFLNNGQRLRIEGRDGLVTVEQSDRHRNPYGESTRTQPPSRGELHDVVVSVFEKKDDEQPTMRVTMNNASFDNETYRINTEGFIDPETRRKVPGDMVPVTMVGRDYDFKGKGMTIRWNDRDRRLQLLEIQHGDVLVLKHPKQFGPMKTTPVDESRSATKPVARVQPTESPWRGSIDLLALLPTALLVSEVVSPAAPPPAMPAPATSPQRVGRTPRSPNNNGLPEMLHLGLPTSKPHIKPSNEPPFYRADFEGNVRIVQNDEQLITAEQMLVDFLLKQGGDSESTTAPATTASATTIAPATAASGPVAPATTRASARAGRTTANFPTTLPTTVASTEPSEQPVYVYWTGPLRVTPRQIDAAVPPGESIITFEGAPVIAHQQGSEIRAASLTYKSEDGSTYAQESAAVPLVLTRTDAHGPSIVHATSLIFSRTSQLAVMRGRGDVRLPVQSEATEPQSLEARWTQSCTLHFAGKNNNEMAIDTADLEGDVDVKHPQMKLTSQSLELTFDPTAKSSSEPATRPTTAPANAQSNLRKLVATGNVHCDLSDAQATKTIDTDRLVVLCEPGAEGRLVPRTIVADGRVHTVTPDEDLRAGHLTALVTPATRPATNTATTLASTPSTLASTQPALVALQLQSLTANDHVHVVMKDGTIAQADTLLVNSTESKPTVKLLGTPYATVSARQSTIQGAIIDVVPDSQQMTIDGAGAMHGVQQAPNGVVKPLDITWTRNVQYDGIANTIDCIGGVMAKSVDVDGTVNVASGERMKINLVSLAPATQPTTQSTMQMASTMRSTAPNKLTASASATSPGTSLATAPADHGLFANKAIRDITFTDPQNSEVHSSLLDDKGRTLREVDLFATTIEFHSDLNNGQVVRRVVIPVAGRMLVEDHRPQPSATQPLASPAAASTPGMGDSRGTTAFQWTRRMTYDDSTQLVIMEGADSVVEADKVIIDHRDDVPNPEPLRLAARQVITTIAPVAPVSAPAPRGPATASATAPSTEQKLEIKHLTATGNLVVYVKGGILHADHLDYDPGAHLMRAFGSKTQPAVFEHDPAPGKSPQRMAADELVWDLLQSLPQAVGAKAELRK